MTKTTLPLPALADQGMPWIVSMGTLGFRAAFEHEAHAVRFAQDIANDGTPVSLGHAVHGWFDLFSPFGDDPVKEVRAWEARMKEEA